MVVEILDGQKPEQEEPVIKPTQVTVNVFNSLKEKEKYDPNLTSDEAKRSSTVNKVKVNAWTQDDDQTHA